MKKQIKKVFISSPLSDIDINGLYCNSVVAMSYSAEALKNGCAPYCPHGYTPLIDSDPKMRDAAIQMSLTFLQECDEYWCWPILNGGQFWFTFGMYEELKVAIELGIPIVVKGKHKTAFGKPFISEVDIKSKHGNVLQFEAENDSTKVTI